MQRVASSILTILSCIQLVTSAVNDLRTLNILMNTTADIIHDTTTIVTDMEYIRVRIRSTAEFECGYLNKVLEEFFRKQVNMYNTSKYMNTRLYTEELVLYLQEIEYHYWQIEQVSLMLHEVERKYNMDEEHDEFDVSRFYTYTAPSTVAAKHFSLPKWNFFKYLKKKVAGTSPTPEPLWPKEYGWEIENHWK